ncbi:MAG: hypothetical protein V8R75_00390, partial [Oscillospiraceae bacterium]
NRSSSKRKVPWSLPNEDAPPSRKLLAFAGILRRCHQLQKLLQILQDEAAQKANYYTGTQRILRAAEMPQDAGGNLNSRSIRKTMTSNFSVVKTTTPAYGSVL